MTKQDISNQEGSSKELAILAAALNSHGVRRYTIDEDDFAGTISPGSLRSLVRPTKFIRSRYAPGYEVVDLDGLTSDKAVARLLAQTLDTVDALADFALLLRAGDGITEIISKLYPRADTAIGSRKTKTSEDHISDVVHSALSSSIPVNVKAAFAHVFVQFCAALGKVERSAPKSTSRLVEETVSTMDQLRADQLESAMRGVFDVGTLKVWAAKVDPEATPALLAEKFAEMFRHIAALIPAIARSLRQWDIALSAASLKLLLPSSLPDAVVDMPELDILLDYANITLELLKNEQPPLLEEAWVIDQAVRSAVQLIASSEGIEVLELDKYANEFYMTPAAPSKGGIRAMIIGRRLSQASTNTVVTVTKSKIGTELTEIDPNDSKGALIAPEIQRSVTGESSFQGVLDIMADAVSKAIVADDTINPELWTVRVTEADIQLLAMWKARNLMIVKDSDSGVFRIIYDSPVHSEWRSKVLSSIGDAVTFASPEAAVLYAFDMQARVGAALPKREQGLGLKPLHAKTFITPIDKEILSRKLAKPFTIDLAITGIKAPLTLNIPMLTPIHMAIAEKSPDLAYAYIREPGVDSEARALFGIVAFFMKHSDATVSDEANNWLMSQMVSFLGIATYIKVAAHALSKAAIAARADLRALPSQRKELQAKALLATLLGILERYEKIDSNDVGTMVEHVKISTLSATSIEAIRKMTSSMLLNV